MIEESPEILRKCSRCREQKSLGAFGINRKKKHGRQYRCRECMRTIDRARREDPEVRRREAEQNRRYRSDPVVKAQMAAQHKLYYEQNADRYRARARERHHRCWSERLIYSAQSASRMRSKRGRDCKVTITRAHLEALWVEQGGLCYFTGMALVTDRDRLDTVSIDRLDPSGGYEPGNVVLSTKAANFARTGHSAEDFLGFLARLIDALPGAPIAKKKTAA